MLKLFDEGGAPFMGLLTILLLLIIIQTVRTRLKFSNGAVDFDQGTKMAGYVRSLGILAFVLGVLAQLIGLYSAFGFIQEVGQISQVMLISGIKVSMITTIYGLIILVISMILWMVLDANIKRQGDE